MTESIFEAIEKQWSEICDQRLKDSGLEIEFPTAIDNMENVFNILADLANACYKQFTMLSLWVIAQDTKQSNEGKFVESLGDLNEETSGS